jgi:hypothetical protein
MMTTTPAGLAPIRILPIPEFRPAALPEDVPLETLALGAQRVSPFIQDALAFELMPRRSDAERVLVEGDLPDPQEWMRATSQAILEVMAGLRPPSQVVRSCAPEVYLAIARRHTSAARRAAAAGVGASNAQRVCRPTVARVRLSRPRPDAVEAVVLLLVGPRVRAMAVAAHASPTGWRITALELG